MAKNIKVDLFNISKEKDRFNFFRYYIENKGGDIYLLDRPSKVLRRILSLGKGTLMRGEIKKEEAEFFFFPSNGEEVIRLSFFYPEGGAGGIRLDSYSFKIPFNMKESDFDCFKNTICIASKKEKKYVMINKEKDQIYNGLIKAGENIKVKMFGEEKAFILTEEGIYVIKEGKRGFISKNSLPFSPMEINSWGKKREDEKDFLALGTERKILLISLNKENLFYFGVFDKNPFNGLLE